MHGGQVAVHGLDQRVVDALRDLVLKERLLPAGGIAPRLGKEDVLLDGGGIRRGDGVGQAAVGRVVGLIGLLAHGAVRALQERDEAAVRQLHLLAVLARDKAELHVRVGEHGVDGVRRGSHLPGLRQERLLRLAERVRLQAQLALQQAAEALQLRVRAQDGLDLLAAERQDLRAKVGRCRAPAPPPGTARGSAQALVGRVAVVLVPAHARIGVQAGQQELRLLQGAQGLGELLLQLSGKGGDARGGGLRLLEVLLPRLVRGVDVLQFPQEARIHLRAGFLLFGHLFSPHL